MKCFQILNDDILVIDGQKEYHEPLETFLLDGGSIGAIKVTREGVTEVVEPKKVIYDDNQCCCVVNDVFYDYPNEDIDDFIGLIDTYIKSKEKREYVPPTFEEIVTTKLSELKSTRDTLETEAIEYQGSHFDYDDKARDRINAAIIALDITGQSIEWTTADNTNVTVTAQDLRNIIAAVAVRSNELHVKYRNLKEQVLACTTAEEVTEIVW